MDWRADPGPVNELTDAQVVRPAHREARADDRLESLGGPGQRPIRGDGKMIGAQQIGAMRHHRDRDPPCSQLDDFGGDAVGEENRLMALLQDVAHDLILNPALSVPADDVVHHKGYFHHRLGAVAASERNGARSATWAVAGRGEAG